MKAILSATAILSFIALIIGVSGCSALVYWIQDRLTVKEVQRIPIKVRYEG